ncbi:MAG TPA: DUF2071 domain-containing protein [Isosphaeraceae bacterium]|jgi:hypothetical protein
MTLDARPDLIDRLSPRRRPDRRPAMYQEWYHLLFIHWEVPAEPLRALLPPGLDLDTFEGRAFVGLVPFTMQAIRPRSLPSVPCLSNFHETNVRTYVHRDGRDPGVWFFSLDAANPVAVAIARATFGLPYFHARMCVEVDPGTGAGPSLTYVSERVRPARRPALSEVRARVVGPVEPAEPGSLEFFLAERYLLYSTRKGHLRRGQVHHGPYPLQRAGLDTLDETLLAAAGIDRPDVEPLVHYASGVRVEVFGLSPT